MEKLREEIEKKYVIFEATDLIKSDDRIDNPNEYVITLKNKDGQLFYSIIRPNTNVNNPHNNGILLKQTESGFTEQESTKKIYDILISRNATNQGEYYYGFKKKLDLSRRGGQSATFRQRNPKRRTRRATRRRRV